MKRNTVFLICDLGLSEIRSFWYIWFILKERPRVVFLRRRFVVNKPNGVVLLRKILVDLFAELFFGCRQDMGYAQIVSFSEKKLGERVRDDIPSIFQTISFPSIARKVERSILFDYGRGYLCAKKMLREGLEKIYLYNGRPPILKGVGFYVKDQSIPVEFNFIEVTKAKRIYHSKSPPWFHKARYELAKENQSTYSKEAVFFDIRRKGLDEDGKRFSSLSTLKPSKKYELVFFTSSLDEQISEKMPLDFVHSLCKSFVEMAARLSKDYTVCFRVHPNLSNKDISELSLWRRLLGGLPKSIDCYWEDSRINSYDLIKSARVIFTMGSTIGGEAAYCGKPVIDIYEHSLARLTGLSFPYSADVFNGMLMRPKAYTFNHSDLDDKKRFQIFSAAMLSVGVSLPEFLK